MPVFPNAFSQIVQPYDPVIAKRVNLNYSPRTIAAVQSASGQMCRCPQQIIRFWRKYGRATTDRPFLPAISAKDPSQQYRPLLPTLCFPRLGMRVTTETNPQVCRLRYAEGCNALNSCCSPSL